MQSPLTSIRYRLDYEAGREKAKLMIRGVIEGEGGGRRLAD